MSGKPRLIMPTDEEHATINRGIAADPDTYEVSREQMKTMRACRQAKHDQPNRRATALFGSAGATPTRATIRAQ
jgi:hypothetical protein